MAYEYQYESGIKNIIHRHNLWVSDTDYKNAKESLNEVYRKAKAFDHIKVIYDKNMNEMSISDAECIEMIGNELEGADDER